MGMALEDAGVVIDRQLSLREGLKRSGTDFVGSHQQFISGKGCALRDCGKHHSLTAIFREQRSQRETTTCNLFRHLAECERVACSIKSIVANLPDEREVL
jgi:hypothetical protein